MNRYPKFWNMADEAADYVRCEHKGRYISNPRDDFEKCDAQKALYRKISAVNGQVQLNQQRSLPNLQPTPSVSTSSTLSASSSSITLASYTSTCPERTKTLNHGENLNLEVQFPSRNSECLEKQESSMEEMFTLDDMFESRETVIKSPETEKKLKSSPAAQSASEVTEKLFHLKLKVVSLIDETITQFESEGDLSPTTTSGETETIPQQELPSSGNGDEPKINRQSGNRNIMKVKSLAQDKKDIRLKLYREIEGIMRRLKDVELFE